MPIQVENLTTTRPVSLCEWTTQDIQLLAKLIAYLLLGRQYHVRRILSFGQTDGEPLFAIENIDEAVKHLAEDPTVHRDGWLFQFISWIVYTREHPATLTKAPQPRPADKGFDGLSIDFDGDEMSFITIWEDKATDNPRSTVTDDVFQSFRRVEAGDRDNELVAEAACLLSLRQNLDVDSLLRAPGWYKEKRYRASVATSLNSLPPRVDLFEGFDACVPGPSHRRQGNLLKHENIRQLFHTICDAARGVLESLRPT